MVCAVLMGIMKVPQSVPSDDCTMVLFTVLTAEVCCVTKYVRPRVQMRCFPACREYMSKRPPQKTTGNCHKQLAVNFLHFASSAQP